MTLKEILDVPINAFRRIRVEAYQTYNAYKIAIGDIPPGPLHTKYKSRIRVSDDDIYNLTAIGLALEAVIFQFPSRLVGWNYWAKVAEETKPKNLGE